MKVVGATVCSAETAQKRNPTLMENEASKKYPTDAEIAKVMEERKLNRIGAVHFLRRQAAQPTAKPEVDRKATREAHAGKKPAVKKAPKATAKLPAISKEQVKVDRAKLDKVIREALTAGFGHPCAVLGVLGQRWTAPSKKYGFPYYRVLVDAGKDGLKTLFVSGFYEGQMKTSISDAVKSSYTVKALLARIARRTKRAAEKLEGKKS